MHVGSGIRRTQIRRLVGKDILGRIRPLPAESDSTNPTDFTPGIVSSASIIRLCMAGTLSPL